MLSGEEPWLAARIGASTSLRALIRSSFDRPALCPVCFSNIRLMRASSRRASAVAIDLTHAATAVASWHATAAGQTGNSCHCCHISRMAAAECRMFIAASENLRCSPAASAAWIGVAQASRGGSTGRSAAIAPSDNCAGYGSSAVCMLT